MGWRWERVKGLAGQKKTFQYDYWRNRLLTNKKVAFPFNSFDSFKIGISTFGLVTTRKHKEIGKMQRKAIKVLPSCKQL